MQKFGLGLCLAAAAALGALQARAAVDYAFVCTSPADCDGDAGFSTVFTFDVAMPAALAGQVITAANPLFLGWTTTSDFGTGYDVSSTVFLGDLNSEIAFAFSFDGETITGITDVRDSVLILKSPSQGPDFQLGLNNTYFLTNRWDGAVRDETDIHGVFTAQTAVIPLPAGLPLLAGALALLGAAGRAPRRHRGNPPPRRALRPER